MLAIMEKPYFLIDIKNNKIVGKFDFLVSALQEQKKQEGTEAFEPIARSMGIGSGLLNEAMSILEDLTKASVRHGYVDLIFDEVKRVKELKTKYEKEFPDDLE